MRTVVLASVITATVVATAFAAALPGFRLEKVAPCSGFPTSLAFDSEGRLHYSVTKGKVFRLDGSEGVEIASVNTAAEGNAALLGIAFRGESEIVFHYVEPDLTADVIEVRNLATGETLERHELVCSDGQACPTEHHGGNPIVAPDGAIFVGIGDFGGGTVAQNPASPGGKIFRIPPGGPPRIFALGFRNPFDFVFHQPTGKLIVADNGPIGEDEINVIGEGDNAGWPLTMGNQPPVEGMVAPIFTFSETVAPTGVLLNEAGLLLGSFVTKALYYFPDLSRRPLSAPIEIFRGEVGMVIDVAQNAEGEIFIATASAIYRLIYPKPGDADGNGRIEVADFEAISREILDGDGYDTIRAQEGSYRGSWGADVNQDGMIDARDLVALGKMRVPRNRPARP